MSADPSVSSNAAWTFSGFSFPNTTPIPDQVFDELLHLLSGAELKVLLYICRRTFGFKKASDDISLNQLLHGIVKRDGIRIDFGTGLSKPSLIKALKDLQEKGIVIAVRQASEEKGNEPTNYRLRFVEIEVEADAGEGDKPQTVGQDQPEKNFTPLGKKTLLGARVKKFTKPLVKKLYPQQTGLQETEINNNKEKTAAVVDVLIAEGIESQTAHQLASLAHVTLEVVRKQIDQRDFLLETTPERVKRPTAFLVRAIERAFPEPDGYRPKAIREAEAEAKRQENAERRHRQAQMEQQVQAEQSAQQHALDQKRQSEAEQLAQLQAQWGTGDAEKQLWQRVLVDLQGQLKATIGYSVIEHSVLLSVENGEAVIAVPNNWAREYVTQRLSHPICQALAPHLGGQSVKVRCITPELAPVPSLATEVANGVTADSHPDRQLSFG